VSRAYGGEVAARLSVPHDHPALPGHFPGRPIVPGVLLLDAVLEAAAFARGRLLRAKFTAPVLPGDPVEIMFDRRDAGRIAFSCRCRGTVVLSGELACSPLEPPP